MHIAGCTEMVPVNAGVCLSALFIDFDNIYLSLKSRDEEAAARFARNPSYWLGHVVSGALVRTDVPAPPVRRRIAVGRCYGNPVPRRSGREGTGDPTSFAFVRHSFMRAGLEVVDCPHLTSQFKNSSDIRIACDVRDYLDHPTRFDEFIILSGDADFTPVLLSLRSHNRQTIIYTNEYTSPYYKAFSDGRIREDDLIRCLMQPEAVMLAEELASGAPAQLEPPQPPSTPLPPPTPSPLRMRQGASLQRKHAVAAVADPAPKRKAVGSTSEAAIQSLIDDFKVIGDEILSLVLDVVENSEKPVPLAYLADRAQKTLGHPKTIGTNWAGSGGFLNFLTQNLPGHLRLSDKPPHFVYDQKRHRLREEVRAVEQPAPAAPAPAPQMPVPRPQPVQQQEKAPVRAREPQQQTGSNGRLAELQRSITRIYEACQAPPLPPSEYQLLFTLIAAEVRENGFAPERSAQAVVTRAAAAGLKLSLKDVSFVLDAVDEIDPWLEHTRSPAAVARAYRDYVLGQCSQVGLDLTDDEYQLIQVWFGASQWASPAASGTSEAARVEAALPQDLSRRYGQPDLGLPAPNTHGSTPLPSEFGMPESERQAEPVPSSNLRYSFLKHG